MNREVIDRHAIQGPLERVRTDAKSLTEEDIATLKAADPEMGRRARLAWILAKHQPAEPFHALDIDAAYDRARLGHPLEITDSDIAMIHSWQPEKARKAFERREAALSPDRGPAESSWLCENLPDNKGANYFNALKSFFKRNAHRAARVATVMELTDRMIEPLRKFALEMNEANATRNAKIEALGQRCAALEARPLGLKYRGVYEPGAAYFPDEAVTSSGSLWVCRTNTRTKPGGDGESGSAWQLAVKKGADGKDAR